MLLPLLFGLVAYFINREERERDMTWRLTKHQLFNCDILKDYLLTQNILVNKSKEELAALKSQITSHGWDIAVVERAFEDVGKRSS